MKRNLKIFYILIILPIMLALFILFNDNLLIPRGYELGVDGVVISRNLYILFILYLIAKVGFLYAGNKKE